MQIQLNGKSQSLTATMTIAQLVEQNGLAGRRVAVELNGEIIPRKQHAQRQLAEGDSIEIVQAIGGG